KTSFATSKLTPCLTLLARFFASSQTNRTIASRIYCIVNTYLSSRGETLHTSCIRQPPPNARHRLVHFGGRAGVAEADEVLAADGIEIAARRRRDVGFLQQAPREVVAVGAKPRHVGVEIEGAVDG